MTDSSTYTAVPLAPLSVRIPDYRASRTRLPPLFLSGRTDGVRKSTPSPCPSHPLPFQMIGTSLQRKAQTPKTAWQSCLAMPCGRSHLPQQGNIASHAVTGLIFLVWSIVYLSLIVNDHQGSSVHSLHIAGMFSASFLFFVSAISHYYSPYHHDGNCTENGHTKRDCSISCLSTIVYPWAGIWRAVDIMLIYLTLAVNSCADLALLSMALGTVDDTSGSDTCDACSHRESVPLRLPPQAFWDPCVAAGIAIGARLTWQCVHGHYCPNSWVVDRLQGYSKGFRKQNDGAYSGTLSSMFGLVLLWWVGHAPLAVATLPGEFGILWIVSCAVSSLSLVAGALYFIRFYSDNCCLASGVAWNDISCFKAWCGYSHFHWHLVCSFTSIMQIAIRQLAIGQLLGDCDTHTE